MLDSARMGDAVDKKALLNELKIDRAAAPVRSARPVRWFIALAVIAGIAFVFYFVSFGRDVGAPVAAAPLTTTPVAPAAPAPPAKGASILDATGYVVARREATVSAKVTGKVTAVFIEEGVRVEKDQLLAQLDDATARAQLNLTESQLSAARASLKELDVQIHQAQLNLDRTRGQADLDRDTLSLEAIVARRARAGEDVTVAERNVDLQRRGLDDMEVRAPFAGVVVAKAAQPGEIVSPMSAGGGFTRTGICTIVDMDSLEVEVDVNEAYINRVQPGQPVRVALNAYPDDPIKAAVIAIIPTADRNKATVKVRIGFKERNAHVLPDMGVKVAFLSEEKASTEEEEHS
jgi:RND family efflux transporter MFP subunit